MTNNVKVRDLVSKVVITDKARPEIVQDIFSWLKDSEPLIIYKKSF